MAQAECQNCGKGPWRLQKHPANYSGNGPNCPDCGSTRVDIIYDDGEESGQAVQGGQGNQQRGGVPARQQRGQQRQGAQGGVPAAQGGQGAGAGEAIAQGLMVASSDEVSTQQKTQAARGILGVAVDGVTRFMEYRDELDRQQEEHAKNVGLEKADDKPRCLECDYVFSRVPQTKDRITCPDCGEEYIVKSD